MQLPNTTSSRLSAQQRIDQISPTIKQICEISGTAGASIGILHEGHVLETVNYGFRDVEAGLVPGSKTIYGIGSMTKAFVAAGIGHLVSQGKLKWTTPIRDIIPEWNSIDPTFRDLTTIVDCLAHRTGLNGRIDLTFQGDGETLLPNDQLFPLINSLRSVFPFREKWGYNNFGYATAAIVIERLSGKNLDAFLRETIYSPLNLHHTTTQPDFSQMENLVEPYSTLENAQPHHLKKRQAFANGIWEGTGGMFTNIDDMLLWAQAILSAAGGNPDSPLKEMDNILSSQIAVAGPSKRERTYGMGWIRTQLPGILGVMGDNVGIFDLKDLPELARDSPSRLVLYHQGSTVGYFSCVMLFPETGSAVVVLTNSIALCDAADLMAQAYAQALFGFETQIDFVGLAGRLCGKLVRNYRDLKKEMERKRKEGKRTRELDAYEGSYWNELRNFVMVIRKSKERNGELEVLFQGRETQRYGLRYLVGDTFEWAVTLDEEARRGRYREWEAGVYELRFGVDGEGVVSEVRWARTRDIFRREG